MGSIIRLAAALVLGIAASSAAADVVIARFGNNFNYFYGHLASAATATQLNAYVQCGITQNMLSCAANDDQGQFVTCTTTDANVKAMFSMMDKSSLFQVLFDDAGTCTRLAVFNSTRNLKLSSPAGARNSPVPVFVSMGEHVAGGSIGARPAVPDNNNEGVWCMERSDGFIQCVATDSNRQSVQCISFRDSASQTIADQQIAVRGLNEYSYVFFSFDSATPQPNCLSITVINASYYAPQ